VKQEEKAYKLLALQEDISNRAAKDLIDQGLVHAKGKKVLVARGNVAVDTEFHVQKPPQPSVIFENERILVLDKPALVISEELAKRYGYPLLHRLDKETSGVLIMVKDPEYQAAAIEEFRAKRVEKVYFAAVSGKFIEPAKVDSPILTTKGKGGAVSKIAANGKEAVSVIEPHLVEGKNSLVKVTIETGRTHQIRVHLRSLGFAILGDEKYGGRQADRMMLHAHSLTLFGQTFKAPLPSAFRKYGFSV
jgi:23S rRNA pseudouridine955/2504/2580 synthase/23S rRNA pseudouridine1911/1915/1917 synthase